MTTHTSYSTLSLSDSHQNLMVLNANADGIDEVLGRHVFRKKPEECLTTKKSLLGNFSS